eukprot:4866677-Lingulodinium_polyedra.AAC.1
MGIDRLQGNSLRNPGRFPRAHCWACGAQYEKAPCASRLPLGGIATLDGRGAHCCCEGKADTLGHSLGNIQGNADHFEASAAPASAS